MEKYIAGECNIGSEERRRRLRNGWLYLGVTVLFLLVIFIFNIPRVFRLAIYIPVILSVLGFLQAKQNFCVLYGLRNEYKLDKESGAVINDEDRFYDKKTSINIIIIAMSISFIITLFIYIIY